MCIVIIRAIFCPNFDFWYFRTKFFQFLVWKNVNILLFPLKNVQFFGQQIIVLVIIQDMGRWNCVLNIKLSLNIGLGDFKCRQWRRFYSDDDCATQDHDHDHDHDHRQTDHRQTGHLCSSHDNRNSFTTHRLSLIQYQ